METSGMETDMPKNIDTVADEVVFDENYSGADINDFLQLQHEDYQWKVGSRKWSSVILFFLLLFQNFVVFGLVAYALLKGKLDQLQIIFGVLVPATLGETVLMVKIIVEWLFSDINYPE